MTQTPPAADGGLPGPLPWSTVKQNLTVGVNNADGKKMFYVIADTYAEVANLVAWINAQAARLAEKDAEIARERHVADEAAKYSLALIAQLVAATSRLASAEAVIAPFAKFGTGPYLSTRPDNYQITGSQDEGKWLTLGQFRTARAWLTSKDGEKQP